MTHEERRLRRHLFIALALKLAALVLLWWFFFSDRGIGVDADQAAIRLGVEPSSQGAPR